MIRPNVSHCVQEVEVHYNPIVPPDYSQEYLTFVAKEDGTFKLSGKTVQYSLDNGETWASLASNTNSPMVTASNKIMWKATLTPSSSSGIGRFSSTGNYDIEGNPMSLLYGDDFVGKISGCTKAISAENMSLPATTLADYCYREMFSGCTSLTTAPELPATTLTYGCYYSMFRGCTSLTTAPELPATTLETYCYQSMFYSCTSLTTAPELPATELATYCCEYMFYGCTSLTTAPELPATRLANKCYQYMFQGCTNLTTAPELPATTLAENCYTYMFNGCRSLNYIKAMFTTTPGSSYTSDWVSGVAASGTFVKNSAAEWDVTGVDGIPSGWNVQTASA